jgi:hypothetical protein
MRVPAERALEAEFSFEPHVGATLDALYVARPELRGKIAGLLGVSSAGMVAGVVTAIRGAHLFLWVGFLAFGALALGVLAWWALSQCHGSVFASGPGTVYADDHGLLVRPAGGEPARLPWSSLRGWVENERVVVLLPAGRSGRPLHAIPAGAIEASDSALVFRELLLWHLGKPKG